MSINRTQLNDLIFHNRTVLPRTSSGYGEVSLAVAELQGGNYPKAAMLAEIAVSKDPSLAAGWLAKTVADVFEATPLDLRAERAVFCLERAVECAPACRAEMVQFFVANIFGHYVKVLCSAAVEEVEQWMDTEEAARRKRCETTLLEALGLTLALGVVFSRSWGARIMSGVASVVAFSEGARRERDAQLLELAAHGHRTASLLHLVPARDLIGLAAPLLQAEGLSPRLLEPMIQEFTSTFRQVLGTHLRWLEKSLSWPIQAALDGDADQLVRTYDPDPKRKRLIGRILCLTDDEWAIDKRRCGEAEFRAYAAPHPDTRATLLWLDHMLPTAGRLDAYQLLAFPLPIVCQTLYDITTPSPSSTITERISLITERDRVALGCLGTVLFLGLFSSAAKRRAYQRAWLRRRFASVWSVDTWLNSQAIPSIPPLQTVNQAVAGSGRAITNPQPLGWVTDGWPLRLLIGAVVGIALILAIASENLDPPRPKQPAKTASPAPAATISRDQPSPPEVRRALAVEAPTTAAAPVRELPVLPVVIPRAASPVSALPALPVSVPNEPPPPTPSSYMVVGVGRGDALNVRAGPGANTPVTARLSNGSASVEITGPSVMNERTEWLPIRFGERTGWVSRQHLQPE